MYRLLRSCALSSTHAIVAACAIITTLIAPLTPATAAPIEPGSREFHEQLWPVAFGQPYVHGQSSITLGDEVAPGIREVLLFDYSTWASTGEMISVGFFAQDASFPVSWLPAEQQQLDTSGELFEFTGTIFSSFTAVSGILQTHTGFSTYLSALVDQTVLKLDAPADATSGTEFAVMTLAPQQTFATASEALIAAAVFSGAGLTEVNLGNGGQDGCAATCANTYNACLAAARIVRDGSLAACSYWDITSIGAGCVTGATLCAPGGLTLSAKCCVFGGVVGAIMNKAQCRAKAHNKYATDVQLCRSQFVFCMAGCGIIIVEW